MVSGKYCGGFLAELFVVVCGKAFPVMVVRLEEVISDEPTGELAVTSTRGVGVPLLLE